METTFQIITNTLYNSQIVARQARTNDTDDVIRLITKTAKWLRDIGSTQWNALLEGKDRHNMVHQIERGNVFIFRDNGFLAGVVMLLPQPGEWDRQLWGQAGHEHSIYVHRLAIDREYAGQQLGQAIMHWVANGILFPGKQIIRLDCVADNPKLMQFYSNLGFEYVSTHSSGFLLWEKPLTA